MPEEIKEKLSKASLWVLAWQLRAYKETGDVDRDAVCREVEHYLEKLTEQGIENAEDIFLILSVFYKYEIPVRRKFVEKLVCSSKKDIEKLIKIREINETKEKGRKYLGLHHSEIAGVYLDLFRNLEFEGVGEEMKKKVEEKTGKDWFEGLFHWYICEFPEECVMLGNLSHYEPELIKNLVEENFDMVKKGIEAEEDIGEIGWCIKGISEGSKGVAEKLIYILRDKIDFKEDLLGIGWCIKGISEGNKKLAEKLIPVVKDKIEAEEDIFSIDFCIRGIAVASKEFAEKLVNGLDFEILKDKIETEEEVFKIDVFIDGIDMRSKEIASNLVNQLDPEKAKTPEVRTEIIRLKKEYNLISNTR